MASLALLVGTFHVARAFRDRGNDAVAASNIRELRNMLERAALRCEAGVITASHIPFGPTRPQPDDLEQLVTTGSYDEVHDELDRRLIIRILDEVGGNISEAARRLDVGRKKLTTRMKALGSYSPE